ncbi:hypothetical protein BSKO_13675 [Bryopsis sp. KO-2023]|nr:hypothetical protein BSKO_13675 [Bryopsis sp. KO-2023]
MVKRKARPYFIVFNDETGDNEEEEIPPLFPRLSYNSPLQVSNFTLQDSGWLVHRKTSHSLSRGVTVERGKVNGEKLCFLKFQRPFSEGTQVRKLRTRVLSGACKIFHSLERENCSVFFGKHGKGSPASHSKTRWPPPGDLPTIPSQGLPTVVLPKPSLNVPFSVPYPLESRDSGSQIWLLGNNWNQV